MDWIFRAKVQTRVCSVCVKPSWFISVRIARYLKMLSSFPTFEGLVFGSRVSQTKATIKEKVILLKMWYILRPLCFFHSLELFHLKTKHCHMFLPPGSMPSECIKYQVVFTMRLAFTEATFSNNAFCYETPSFHAHTLQSIWPLYIFNPQWWQSRKETSKLSFLKVKKYTRNIQYNCVLSIASSQYFSFVFLFLCDCNCAILVFLIIPHCWKINNHCWIMANWFSSKVKLTV